MANLATTITEAIREGLSLWQTFISTRQRAYERKMDKRKNKAIEYGEKFILLFYSDEENKDKKLDRYQKKFFKYNN